MSQLSRPVGTAPTPAVLVVDDDELVLDVLTHQLGRDFRVLTAPDGGAALRLLDQHGTFAAVLSDMWMPGIDGVELLGRVRDRSPETSRVLYTAQADVGSAISAINSGQVFRYLQKPCPSQQLRQTMRDAVDRYQHAIFEREVREKTLQASLQALFHCLRLASPAAYARAERVRDLAAELGRRMGLADTADVQVAAMVSQLGALTLPSDLLAKLDRGLPLSDEEQLTVAAMPDVSVQLIESVPLLDGVISIVRALRRREEARTAQPIGPETLAAVQVLRAALEYQAATGRGLAPASAVAVLEWYGHHEEPVLAALREVTGAAEGSARAYKVGELDAGMRIAEDVHAVTGLVLISRGMPVNDALLDRLATHKRRGQLVEPIVVRPTAA